MSGQNSVGVCTRSMGIQVFLETGSPSPCSATFSLLGDPLFPMFYHRTVWGQDGPEVNLIILRVSKTAFVPLCLAFMPSVLITQAKTVMAA